MQYDPSKPIGLIATYTRNATFNIGGVTLHSAFYMPFNNKNCLSLNNENLDTLSKHYGQLRVVLIDEASLVGATTLYQIDKRLRQILHMPTCHFANIDVIFLGDLYQAQPVKDSMIFESPKLDKNVIPYDFWKQNIKCYQLKTAMHQKDTHFVTVLNRIRLNEQSKEDIDYINKNCFRPPPLDPQFPYVFYRNKDVQSHNTKMLSLTHGEQIVLNAKDEHETMGTNFYAYEKTIVLPSTILMKKNMLVELYAGNYNTQDGLDTHFLCHCAN